MILLINRLAAKWRAGAHGQPVVAVEAVKNLSRSLQALRTAGVIRSSRYTGDLGEWYVEQQGAQCLHGALGRAAPARRDLAQVASANLLRRQQVSVGLTQIRSDDAERLFDTPRSSVRRPVTWGRGARLGHRCVPASKW